MMYLSDFLQKKVYFNNKPFGKISDISISEDGQHTQVSKIIVKKKREKISLPVDTISMDEKGVYITSSISSSLTYDEKEFYLNEDVLDKQVIDVDGKRLVRVNDVVLEKNGVIKVVGIDIGMGGILRRLGLGAITHKEAEILPWDIIEAFDYQTGTIRVKVPYNKLNTFHPADLADILEEVGTKERLGIVKVLETEKAAHAIEETNPKTQEAILEQLPDSFLRRIVNKMPLSEIADVFYRVNPLRVREILKALGSEKAHHVQQLVNYSQKTAGGLMTTDFFSTDQQITVNALLDSIKQHPQIPEAIILTNGGGKFAGLVETKQLLGADKNTVIKDLHKNRKWVDVRIRFLKLLKIFTQYNLRLLPVLDRDKKPLGIISVDTILSQLEEQQAYDESL